MPDSDVDTPGLGLVREPVSDAIEFFVTLEAALALVWHSWDDDAREAAALAGCVPLKANLLDKGPKDWQDEVMALCDCAFCSLLAAQDMVKELLHTREVAWAHSTATGSVFVVQAPAESKAKTEVHIVHVLLWCEEEVRVFVGRQYNHEAACPLARACSNAHTGVEGEVAAVLDNLCP